MKQLTALAWKEWHEVRAFFWIAVGVFVGLPVVGGFEEVIQYSHKFEISTTPWVLAFGGVLAVFVAVGATCRDFSGHLEDFWRSRPVGVVRWLLVKYVIGLIVVVIACLIPMTLELWIVRDKSSVWSSAWFPFMLPASYSLGFLAGCLVRRPAHAAMLALAAMLMIYLVPIVLPPLNWLSAANITSGGSLAAFAAGMAAVALAALALALFAARQSWRIESGRKMMYGSVALAFFILFGSAAYQLGTNMPILQQVGLTPRENVVVIRCDGNRGFILSQQMVEHPEARPEDRWQIETDYRTLEMTAAGIKLGNLRNNNIRGMWISPSDVWPPGHRQINYSAYQSFDSNSKGGKYWLRVDAMDESLTETNLFLWDEPSVTPATEWRYDPVLMSIWNNRLYVIGHKLVVLDIADARTPRIISSALFPYWLAITDEQKNVIDTKPIYSFGNIGDGSTTIVWNLPPVPGLPPLQRLEAALGVQRDAFDGDVLCVSSGDNLIAYRLTKLTDQTATFESIAQYAPSILEAVFGRSSYFDMQIKNGLLYVSDYGGWERRGASTMEITMMFNPHINVFDTRGNRPLRLIGHFAAPGAGAVCPLPDGRAIVGGSQLWLVGPPPRRGN